MKIFEGFNVYDHEYSYEEMKVMHILAKMPNIYGLDYEDLMCIANTTFNIWAGNIEYDEIFQQYPWLDFEDIEEYGYIQKYAERILPKLINLYKLEVEIND
jgi:hypothetical protein